MKNDLAAWQECFVDPRNDQRHMGKGDKKNLSSKIHKEKNVFILEEFPSKISFLAVMTTVHPSIASVWQKLKGRYKRIFLRSPEFFLFNPPPNSASGMRNSDPMHGWEN